MSQLDSHSGLSDRVEFVNQMHVIKKQVIADMRGLNGWLEYQVGVSALIVKLQRDWQYHPSAVVPQLRSELRLTISTLVHSPMDFRNLVRDFDEGLDHFDVCRLSETFYTATRARPFPWGVKKT